MNNKDPKIFGEYGTKNVNGKDITPASNIITSFGGTFETILTAEQAATYTYDMMFKNNIEKPWDPAALTAQVAAPENVKLAGTKLTWSTADGVDTWAVFKNGQLFGIANAPEYTIDDADATYTVCATNKMGGFSEAGTVPTVITLADSYHATFFDSKNSYALPQGLKAFVVAQGSEDRLIYKELKDVIPAGTAVMLRGEKNQGKTYELKVTEAEPFVGSNLLIGSDEPTFTFSYIKMPCCFYKLAYGPSNTKYARTFGWFWGANNGDAFSIDGHRAWLAIPKTASNARMYIIFSDDDATGIEQPTADSEDAEDFYNLNGQRVTAPTKGLYIRNNKKVIIK
jgi:uncharacterized protein YaiE (UPF0345 family)